jgi:hypothetical protein
MTRAGVARGLQASSTSSRYIFSFSFSRCRFTNICSSFVVKYASADRWGLPVQAATWTIP